MEAGMIGFICTAPEHPAGASAGGSGLTVNDGKWAYCPAGAADGHRWSEIAASAYSDLARAATSAARAGEGAKG